MGKVLIVGAGAAGMMAAYAAATSLDKNDVTIIEKNEKCGKKIYITGKGRCNLSNNCDAEDFFENIVTNKKFMYSSFYTFTNENVYELFSNELGLKLKVERGGRVFPESDKSSDVINALVNSLKKHNVKIMLNTKVTKILTEDNKVIGIECSKGKIYADKIIIATGGMSYKSTGSDGDGYRFARELGHNVTKLLPALVPMNIKEPWIKELQGLSLKNVSLTVFSDKKKMYSGFGEMLFTHFGISGPLVLSASSYICSAKNDEQLYASIDLKPALSNELLKKRIIRDFEEQPNVQFKNSLSKLFPKKLIPVIVNLSGINPKKTVNEITAAEREKLINLIKNLKCSITGLRDINEAIITHGGINVKEINPGTMESKKYKNLYFAGEIIDVDALTGGFNLQIAWSTGYLAGSDY